MALTKGMTNLVWSALLIWLVMNCQEEVDLTGTIGLSGVNDQWAEFTDQEVTLIQMKEPKEEAPFMKWIETLDSENKFGVLRLPEKLKTNIADSLTAMDDGQFIGRFGEVIQHNIYEDIRKEHPNWIVIPMGIARIVRKNQYAVAAHIDFHRNAGIEDLLKHMRNWSVDIMECLAMNEDVKSAALKHCNGNVEQYAIEMLSLDYLMNIWIPIEPIQAWPLAFTPATQCNETRTKIAPDSSGSEHQIQLLVRSESEVNDWYTRWNMQPNEVYVWDSRTVAHAAVKIGDGEGERSSIACRLLIMHSKEVRSTSKSLPPKYNTLCYTERFLEQVKKELDWTGLPVGLMMTQLGYPRLCDKPATDLPPSVKC